MTKAEKQPENSYNIKGYKGACHILLSVYGGGGILNVYWPLSEKGSFQFVMSSTRHALWTSEVLIAYITCTGIIDEKN